MAPTPTSTACSSAEDGSPSLPYGDRARELGRIGERITLNEHEIRPLPCLDGADLAIDTKQTRSGRRRGVDGGQRRRAVITQEHDLAPHHVGRDADLAGVGPGRERDAEPHRSLR